MPMADLDTLKAIEKNGVAHTVYWCHWPRMELVKHEHAVVTMSDLPCPFFNNVFSADVPPDKSEPVIDDLIARFRSRNLPCFWWSGPVKHDERMTSILQSRGFVKAFEAAAMALCLEDLATPHPGPADIFEVTSESQLADWTRTCATAFEFDDNLSRWWHDLFTSVPHGGSSPLTHYLAHVEGEPVGTASAFLDNDVVGLASVGVRTAYRRRGIGSALARMALDKARRRGGRLGTLFSSAMAESLYAGLGFRRYGTGHCYVWSPEAKGR